MGQKFTYVWLLQVFEAAANVGIGFAGLILTKRTSGLPMDMFAMTGATQVIAKYCTNAALASGLSFPVATLAKSGKMVPVMIGSLFIGGAKYSLREYLQVASIVVGTCVVSLSGGKSKAGQDSTLGLVFILGSLVCDGLTGGVQKRLKKKCAERGNSPGPYDFMFWTNFFMMLVAIVFAFGLGEVGPGMAFITTHPEIMSYVIKFSVLSAIGQSFIFYTIATFDPLMCSTVTTTRKIFSVLYSLIFKGHSLNPVGWAGVILASAGVLSELVGKSSKPKPADIKKV